MDDLRLDLTDTLAAAEGWSTALRANVRNGVTRGYSVESMDELACVLDALHAGFHTVEAERDALAAAIRGHRREALRLMDAGHALAPREPTLEEAVRHLPPESRPRIGPPT